MGAETTAPVTAAEVLVERTAAALQRRLAWLESEPSTGDHSEDEWSWHEQVGLDRLLDDIDSDLTGPTGRNWTRLVSTFGLSAREADLLSLAIAVRAEPALGQTMAAVQGDARWLLPTEPLVRRLFCHAAGPIWRPSSPLAVWSLLRPIAGRPGEPDRYEADARIVDLMFGLASLSAELVLGVDTAEPLPVPDNWPVDETAERARRVSDAGIEIRHVLTGSDRIGQLAFAESVARSLGRTTLVVDPSALGGAEWPRAFMLVQRFAILTDTALVWRPGGQHWPRKIPLAPVQFVCSDDTARAPEHGDSVDHVVTLPVPPPTHRCEVWRRLHPALADSADQITAIPGVRLCDLVEVARQAPANAIEASDQLRAQARTRMHGAGRVVDPHFGWDELVLTEHAVASLRRVGFEARMRPQVLDNEETARIFSGTAGLSALFWGPPGVGKSMAAQVIASELEVNLLVVDLATTMSKYIGETAKNLSAIFAEAKAAGAALMFEEADTFFAKRVGVRDANDHYRNGDTNHLLQLLEAHDSLVMLSTNERSGIDPAFIRRLRHVIEFPLPDSSARLELWHRMAGALGMDRVMLTDCLDRLATDYALSPAQIKAAALTARYSAAACDGVVRAEHLEHGADSELVKEGRPAVGAAPRTAQGPRRNGDANARR